MMLRRSIKLWWQRRARGWDDSDTWNLSGVIAEHVLPRLKRFKELNIAYPGGSTPEKWDKDLDKMIASFEMECSRYEDGVVWDGEIYAEGLKLFAENFHQLWW